MSARDELNGVEFILMLGPSKQGSVLTVINTDSRIMHQRKIAGAVERDLVLRLLDLATAPPT
jgi:hypothetical protein